MGSSATVTTRIAGTAPVRWATTYPPLIWGLVGRRSSSPPVATTRVRSWTVVALSAGAGMTMGSSASATPSIAGTVPVRWATPYPWST